MPMQTTAVADAEKATQTQDVALESRYRSIECELEAAPYHKVGTFWWDERIKEMRQINHRLGR